MTFAEVQAKLQALKNCEVKMGSGLVRRQARFRVTRKVGRRKGEVVMEALLADVTKCQLDLTIPLQMSGWKDKEGRWVEFTVTGYAKVSVPRAESGKDEDEEE